MALRKSFVSVVLSGFLFCLLVTPALADSTSGTLWYTTNQPTGAGGNNVFTATYSFSGGVFTVTPTPGTGIAKTPGADGIIFAPNGNLLIGGQDNVGTQAVANGGSGKDIEITKTGTAVTSLTPGNPNIGAYHLAIGPSTTGTGAGFGSAPVGTQMLYSAANLTPPPGGCSNSCISATTLGAGGGLTGGVAQGQYNVVDAVGSTSSHDVRGLTYDPLNNTWYYGTAGDGAGNVNGDFGTVVFNDLTHTATLTKLLSGVFAHGLTYDPFSNTILTVSGNGIQQYNPATNTIVAGILASGTTGYDQVWTDAKGHILVTDEEQGRIGFVDFDTAAAGGGVNHLINGAGASGPLFTALNSFANIDDIVGSTATTTTVPEPASLALVGTGLMLSARAWRRKKSGGKQNASLN